MKTVVLDNHVMVWGVRGVADKGSEAMIPRTQEALQRLRDQKARIVVPTPVISEFLVRLEPQEMDQALAELLVWAQPGPLDVPAAWQAAIIYREAAVATGEPNLLKELQSAVGKQRVKVDIQILAISLVRKASILLSHDAHLRALAEHCPCAKDVIKVMEVPATVKQLSLLDLLS